MQIFVNYSKIHVSSKIQDKGDNTEPTIFTTSLFHSPLPRGYTSWLDTSKAKTEPDFKQIMGLAMVFFPTFCLISLLRENVMLKKA